MTATILGDECMVADDGFAVHRRFLGAVERVTVAVEQVVDSDGTAAPIETIIDGARGEFVAADVRQLIRLLWQAHDLAGGAS